MVSDVIVASKGGVSGSCRHLFPRDRLPPVAASPGAGGTGFGATKSLRCGTGFSRCESALREGCVCDRVSLLLGVSEKGTHSLIEPRGEIFSTFLDQTVSHRLLLLPH